MQNPKILLQRPSIKLNIRLSHPWIVLVRICSIELKPLKVKNVRFRLIDENKVLILWNDHRYANYERCVQTYEIYYAPLENGNRPKMLQWELITLKKHIPFLSYIHQVKDPNKRLEGMVYSICFI